MSFVCFVSFIWSVVVDRLGGERAKAGDEAALDIAFVNTAFNGELVLLSIVLSVINVVEDVLNDGKVGVGGERQTGSGEDVKNSLKETT